MNNEDIKELINLNLIKPDRIIFGWDNPKYYVEVD